MARPSAREIYEIVAPQGSPTYRTMADYDRLRYRLMPYIYTLAADTALARRHDHARPGHGFRGRPPRLDVDDQYLFGPALMARR